MTRFEIQDIIRQNKDGVTFRALDTTNNQTVSLRRFFPFGQCDENEEGGEGLDSSEARDFSSACERLSQVKHPALRRTIFGDVDPIDGMPYLVTEWVEGDSLDEVLGSNTMPPDTAIALVQQVFDVCRLLSQALQKEAIWIDTNPQAIIVSNKTENPVFSFRICPFKWLGNNSSHPKDMSSIVNLIKSLMGWKSNLVRDQAGNGLGGYIKLLRQHPDMQISKAVENLPKHAIEIIDVETEGNTKTPTTLFPPISTSKATVTSKKKVLIMAISACLIGAVSFFFYQQKTKQPDQNITSKSEVSDPSKDPNLSATKKNTENTKTPDKSEPNQVKTRSWSPADIKTAAWFDASDQSTLKATLGPISEWEDKSGNDYHLTQTTSTARPTYVPNTINGLPVLHFDGDDSLTKTITELSLSGIQCAFVAKQSSGGKPYGGVFKFSGTTDQFNIRGDKDSPNLQAEFNTGSGDIYGVCKTPYKYDVPFMGSMSYNGADMTVFSNGNTGNSAIISGTMDITLMNIGGQNGYIGGVGEIVFVHSNNPAIREKLEGYLAHKWGLTDDLPPDHPYKTSAPPPSSSDPLNLAKLPDNPKPPKVEETAPIKSTSWTPSEIETAIWFDAADTATISQGGGFVSQWKDKSGNNRNARQTKKSKQPAYSASSLNDLATLEFDGKSNTLVIEGTAFQLKNLFVVMNAEGGKTFNTWKWVIGSPSPNRTPILWAGDKGTGLGTNIPDPTLHINGKASSDFSPLASFKVVALMSGKSSPNLNTWLIGGGEGFWDGKIAEIIATSGDLTTEEQQKFEGYLAHKWGLTGELPADHPYKSTLPPLSSSDPKTLVNIPENPKPPKEPETTPLKVRLWSPTEMSTTAWYDAADPATISASSGNVSQWKDKSGNNWHMTQSKSANQPVSGAKINGLNALDFTDDFMTTSRNPFGSSIKDAFVIIVHKIDSTKEGSLFTLSGTERIEGRWGSQAPWNDVTIYFDCGGVTPSLDRINVPYQVKPSDIVLTSFYCSTTDNVQELYKNGSLLGANRTGRAVDTVGNIILGGDPHYQDTTIGEFIVIDGTVDQATRRKLEGYLAHKWGIIANLPADHPYKSSGPAPSFLTYKDVDNIKSLKDGDPVNIYGLVRSAKFSSTKKSIYLSFSEPGVESEIRIVIHANEYDGGTFEEAEFSKLVGKYLVFDGVVFREKFNDRPPYVKITEKKQIKLASKTPPKPEAAPLPPKAPVFTPDDAELVAKMNLKEPASVKGVVKSVKIAKTGGVLYFSFSDPWDKKQIQVVTYEKAFENGPHTPAEFKKIEEEYQNLIGKTVTFNGTVSRQQNNRNAQFIFIFKRDQIVIEEPATAGGPGGTNPNPTPQGLLNNIPAGDNIKLHGVLRSVSYNADKTAIVLNFNQVAGVAYKINYKDDFDIKKFEPFVGQKVSLTGEVIVDGNNNKYVEIRNLNQISVL